jgi:hypothetical protein
MVKFTGLQTKLRPTDRFRGGRQYVETWTNARAALIGFLTGRGYSSVAIAESMDDHTSPATIRDMQKKWQLHSAGFSGDQVTVSIPLTVRQRANLADRAAQRGLSIEEYSRRMLICASMPRDRYGDLVPADQFEGM